MRNNKFVLTLVALVLLVGIQMGCGSATAVQYHTIGVVKIAVDTGMNAWADRVIDGKTTPAQEAKVKAAFEAYQNAASGYIDYAIGDKQAAPQNITDAAIKFLNLLASFGVKVQEIK